MVYVTSMYDVSALNRVIYSSFDDENTLDEYEYETFEYEDFDYGIEDDFETFDNDN
jgi:hypothetical protein